MVENNACEQAARMVAMKSATDNAGNLIDDLQLVYNKARQGSNHAGIVRNRKRRRSRLKRCSFVVHGCKKEKGRG